MKHLLDTTALVAAVSAVLHMLPDIAALFALFWYTIRFMESWTGLPFNQIPFVQKLKQRLSRSKK